MTAPDMWCPDCVWEGHHLVVPAACTRLCPRHLARTVTVRPSTLARCAALGQHLVETSR